ncbi:hypothetical protein [Chitinophaga sancti]|uniref:Uncharacterized protein n=1 Tax=Chitinophaga sancti TaxID=1004 RepID=A0A1K1T3R9_9BACT|nr:hypothetical protein [Chitinophaga sancti]WQD60811.1 hypothetical protein U0033_23205 [Chitinophaga sancti]WQG87061.1 hypothetical protein SR876_19265 [Chitinophaga sancti]SFW91158.1 hypothetical protein SAMN05661012_06737 [Chitinophaga sancti]
MLRKTKKDTYVQIGNKQFITVDPSLPSFEGHPFFEKKANAAKRLFSRVGLPKGIGKNSREVTFDSSL